MIDHMKNDQKTPTDGELAALISRAAILKAKLDGMNLAYEARFEAATMRRAELELERELSVPVVALQADGYDPDAALEALQILASSVIVDEVGEPNLRLALNEIATRIEALDDWMSGGGRLPTEWMKRRS